MTNLVSPTMALPASAEDDDVNPAPPAKDKKAPPAKISESTALPADNKESTALPAAIKIDIYTRAIKCVNNITNRISLAYTCFFIIESYFYMLNNSYINISVYFWTEPLVLTSNTIILFAGLYCIREIIIHNNITY